MRDAVRITLEAAHEAGPRTADVVALVLPVQKRPRGRPPGTPNRLRAPTRDDRLVLVPFWTIEAVSAPEAATWGGISITTMHRWCEAHALGRRIGGRWQVSRLALPMYMCGDHVALSAYHDGDRTSRLVLDYFGHMLGPRVMCQK